MMTNNEIARYRIAGGYLVSSLLVSTVIALGAQYALRPSVSAGHVSDKSVWPPGVSVDPHALTAEAAIIYDPASGRVLYAKNDEAQLPLASITKLMTATAVLASADPATEVRVTANDTATYGDSALRPGQTWKLGELIRYGLLASSNDAMAAAAASVGGQTVIAAMNREAEDLGLAQSYFLDPTGLDLTDATAGAYGSARDVALLAADFYKKYPTFFETTTDPAATFKNSDEAFHAKPTDAPILDIPGVIAAKTGYTDLAGGNLVTVFNVDLGHPLVAVVLHSTENGRFSDMRTLIAAARQAATPPTQ